MTVWLLHLLIHFRRQILDRSARFARFARYARSLATLCPTVLERLGGLLERLGLPKSLTGLPKKLETRGTHA